MAGIEDAFEKFADRLAREESKRYIMNQEGDYVKEVQDLYPVKLGPLQLGANANIYTGKYSPNKYQDVSTTSRNIGLRGKYNIPDSEIALLGSIGDVRNTQNVRTNLPFNPMTGEAESYSETIKDVYRQSPYTVGAQYNPIGTDQLFSGLYKKGGGYNLGYNQGPINVSYKSNPGFGNNIMVRGQYNFADGGIASMFRERPEYAEGGSAGGGFTDYLSNPIYQNFLNSPFVDKRAVGSAVITPVTLPTGEILNLPNAATAEQFRRYLSSTPAGGAPVTIPKPVTEPLTPATGLPVTIPKPVTEPLTPETGLPVTTMPVTQPTAEAPIISLERFIAERKFQAEADAAARSNTSFTKTFSDYLPTQTMTIPTLNTNIEQNLILNNLSRLFPENNFYDSLRTNPITSNMQNIYNTSLDRRPISSAFSPTSILGFLESRMGEFQPFANRLNLSQQEAAARVTPRIFGRNGGLADYADGGLASFANGGLTKTVPPAMGPMSQGVESLFRRRYN